MLRVKSNSTTRDQKYVALKSVSIVSKIRSFGADVNITQLFRNDENVPIEAVYCFPIEENAAVYSFVAKIDDREIHAQLKEKIQAQQEYTQALRQGHGAYLMEQDEKSQDIFMISVGALLPGKECQIQIMYVTELDLAINNKIRFVIPTTIAPRYNPSVGGVSSPACTQAKYVQSTPYTIEFHCQVDKLNEEIKSVSSSSHPIAVQFSNDSYEITFAQKNTFMDRDIVIDIDLPARTNTILAVENNGEHQLALMVSFTPTSEDCSKALNSSKNSNYVNNEFIFIVDCSGSMQDENKIGLARQAMVLFLKSLPVDCQFNIIRFGSDYKTLFNNVTEKYNEQNAKVAEQLISHMSADLGGTELLRPLQWLQNQAPSAGHSRQILLLTDGEISNVSQVMDLSRLMSTSSRIFSFGLGHSPSRSLIKGLARSTNGRFTFIPPGASVDIYVAEQLQKALEPCITNVKAKWNIPSLESSKLQTIPTTVPPVYANDRLLLYALVESDQFDHSTTVELWNHEETAQLGLARINRVPEITDKNNQLIAHLAAKALIQELTHSKETTAGSKQMRFHQNIEDDRKKRLITISLKHNILCPHTAFIGIETRTNSLGKDVNSSMVLREIPIEISADDKAMMNSSFGGLSTHFCSISNSNAPCFSPKSCVQQQPNVTYMPASCGGSCFEQPRVMPPLNAASTFFSNASMSRQQPFQLISSAIPPLPPTASIFGASTNRLTHPQSLSSTNAPPPPPPPIASFFDIDTNSQQSPDSSIDILELESCCNFASPAIPIDNDLADYLSFSPTNNVTPNSTFSSSMVEQKTWPSTDQDIVRHLINLQKFDGLWNLSNGDIQNLCQKPLTSFDSIHSDNLTILTTVIVIIVLETKYSAFKTMWLFLVSKGRKRLIELLGDAEKVETLINDIKHQL
ncbi:unnamed protein product [Rotaria sp. Silwood2]|nr:unnamed protein product [Rotaria sp. Silwood2]CAF4403575.1 unnamed protein product [Rotaria sp. Silwood2]